MVGETVPLCLESGMVDETVPLCLVCVSARVAEGLWSERLFLGPVAFGEMGRRESGSEV